MVCYFLLTMQTPHSPCQNSLIYIAVNSSALVLQKNTPAPRMRIDNYSTSYQNPSSSSSPCRGRSLLRRPKPKVLVPKLQNLRNWKLAKQAKEKARMGRYKREMEIKNLKLYMANKIIVDENEKLKRKAMILLQENQILQSQLQKTLELE